MSLAGQKPLKLELDLVRHEENVVAAKFKDLQEGRESLRKFIFNAHKVKHSNLYLNIILETSCQLIRSLYNARLDNRLNEFQPKLVQ
jgi:competence transcription factor ComK